MRSELLGSSFVQQPLKDYNGQTYWFTIDLNRIFNTNHFPKWLSLTIGYGAEGLNASILREKNKVFSYLFAPFVLLKFPAPTIEINFERGVISHPIYF